MGAVVRAVRRGWQLELVRLAFPRRVYTQSHVDYVAEVLLHVNAMAQRIRGVRMLDAPEVLRHFTATFERTWPWTA